MQRGGQRERIGSCVQDASNRLIIGTSAGDGVNGAAALEIEHRDDLEGTVRHGAGCFARRPGS